MTPYCQAMDSYPCGPHRLVIQGPPGTGKSQTMAQDFVAPALLCRGHVLACSFTCAAAGVLVERVAAATGWTETRLESVCVTIHAQAWRLVRHLYPGGTDLQILDGDLPESRLDADTAPAGTDLAATALRAWDLARHLMVPLSAVALTVAPQYTLAALEAEVAAYEAAKGAGKFIDFTDMLLLAVNLEPPRLDLLVVDEAQDLTPLMAALIDVWSSHADHVVQIGDPDQSIHAWCGADPSRLPRLAAAGWEVRYLEKSHRVPRAAHALAVPVIRRCRGRVAAPYEPRDLDGSVTETSLEQTVAEVAAAEATGTDVLVLARSRAKLGRWAAALQDECVPFKHERGPCALGHPDRVATAFAVVRLRQGLEIEAQLVAPLLRQLPETAFHKARRLRITDVVFTTPTVPASWLTARGVLLDPIVTAPGLARALELAGAKGWAAPLAALIERHGERVLTDPPCVALTTMHAAKGRQAPLVVADLGSPRLVRRGLADGPDAVDHERRLVYVALTRTLDRLLLVRDSRHDLGELVGLGPVRPVPAASGAVS